MKAVWNNVIIADSEETIELEGRNYFPPDSIFYEFFVASETTSKCHWKGLAKYFSIKVGNAVNLDAAWYYPNPKKEAEHIKTILLFGKEFKF